MWMAPRMMNTLMMMIPTEIIELWGRRKPRQKRSGAPRSNKSSTEPMATSGAPR